MPVKGWPIAVPSTRSSTKRPPSAHLLSAVPELSAGGFAGSIHIFVATVNEPTIGSSFLWPSPGVAAAVPARAIVTTEINRRCFMVSSCFVTLTSRLILQKAPHPFSRPRRPGGAVHGPRRRFGSEDLPTPLPDSVKVAGKDPSYS